jgi:hypothetical protein
MSVHNRHSLKGRPSVDLPDGTSFDARHSLNATEGFGAGLGRASDGAFSGTVSPLVRGGSGRNSGASGSLNSALMSDAEGGGGGEEPRASLLSEASSKADPTTGAPVFDPTANPAAFESQSYITKLVYSVLCLQWHDNVFDRHSPMAPQMYALESRISYFFQN